MIELSAEEAGRALGRGPLVSSVASVCTDSRRVGPGDLFVALQGERFDGHDFVLEALSKDVSGVVVKESWWESEGATAFGAASGSGGLALEKAAAIYRVDDTLQALAGLAREVRRKSGAKVVAVTGSVGKTSTKDLLSAMAEQVCRVVVTAANQNNEVGVPLTLLAIEPETELVVVEMGMRGLGQIEAVATVAEPDVGVVTNIHPVHLELLGSLESIAKAKAELLFCLRPGGVAVIPAQSALLAPYAAEAPCRVVRFAYGLPDWGAQIADVQGCLLAGEAHRRGGRKVLRLCWPEGEAEVETSFASRHRLENVVAATAACYAAGLSVEQCVAGLKAVRFSRSRGDVLRLQGLIVLDETYNASPAAVRAALDDLLDLAGETGGRPVAVLGDMLELGPEAAAYHEAAGAYAAEAGVAALWGVGPLSKSTVEGFRRAVDAAAGEQRDGVSHTVEGGNVRTAAEALPILAGLRRGDVVLLKASRSMGLETLVRHISEEAAADRWADQSGPAADGARADANEGDKTKGSEA